jgi:outer membrane protein OmpA-like peptidoglycan-associated protein
MRALFTLFIFVLIAGITNAQSYKSFESDFFIIGDSILTEIDIVGGPYYRGWNVKGPDKDRLVRFLERNPRLSVAINVHSDTKGSEKRNLENTQIMSESFIEWLTMDEGFDPIRFSGKGWGEHKPIVLEEDFAHFKAKDRKQRDSIHEINKRVILVIDDVEQKMDCAYRPTDIPELAEYYQIEQEGMINLEDRFRLDFVEFKQNSVELANFDKDRDQYASLAAFILCHPGVKFQLTVHSQSKRSQTSTQLSVDRAKALLKKLTSTFNLSTSRLSAKGMGGNRPMIPQIILDELKDEPAKQAELRKLNERVELEVIGIGAFNDAVQSSQLRIHDPVATREILYRDHTHHLLIQSYFDYDSIQPIASNGDLVWSITKTSRMNWDMTLTVDSEAPEIVHLSFLGWSRGKSKFLYTHAYHVADLGNPSLYIGEQKISDTDLSYLDDEDLFSHPYFTVKYDTSIYHLDQQFDIDFIYIQVGTHKYIVKGGVLSKKVMKSLKRAKVETNIWFAAVIYNDDTTLMVGQGYDKKSGKRQSKKKFYPDYIGRYRIRN